MQRKYGALWILSLVFFVLSIANGQNATYNINAKLDTSNQVLEVIADVTIQSAKYTNSDTLWFHLWSNAYSNTYNSFTEEQLKRGFTAFYFRRDNEFSRIDQLNINEGQDQIEYFFKDSENQILGILKPKTNQIQFSYKLKLPKLIDGVGYSKEAYFLRNFYPKIAYFDQNWVTQNYRQYTDMLEVPCDITMNLKKDEEYFIISNGQQDMVNKNLISAKNIKDLNVILFREKPVEINATYMSGSQAVHLKTIFLTKFMSKNWASLDAIFNKVLAKLESYLDTFPVKEVTIIYGKDCLTCFSSDGIYQTKLQTIVNDRSLESHLAAFLTTVIVDKKSTVDGLSDDWLKEGITTYYYNRYMNETRVDFEEEGDYSDFNIMQEYAKSRLVTPLKTSQELLNKDQIYFNREIMSPALFQYLESVIGKNDIDLTIQVLLQKKGLITGDKLNESLELVVGRSFRAILSKYLYDLRPVDYAVQDAEILNGKLQISIVNLAKDSLPFILKITMKNNYEFDFLVSSFTNQKTIVTDSFDLLEVNEISIDKSGLIPDFNRSNNHYFPNKMLKRGKIKLDFLMSDDLANQNNLFFTFYPAYNNNDGLMAGAVFSNINYKTSKPFSYALAPMFTFKNEKLLGQAWIQYSKFMDKGSFKKIDFRLGIKSFDHDYIKKFDYSLRYIRIDPTIRFHFKHLPVTRITSDLTFKTYLIMEENAIFENVNFTGKEYINTKIFRLDYNYIRTSTLASSAYNLGIEQQTYQDKSYIKLEAKAITRYMYAKRKNLYFRFFAAGFIQNTQRQSNSYQNVFTKGSIALIHQSFNDYTYDEYYFSRNNQNQLQNDQISLENGGGFKTPVGSAYNIGMSNNFASSVNFRSDIPFIPKWIPLQIYFDIGTYSTFESEKFKYKSIYNGGLTINLKNIFSINCPLIFSKELGNIYKGEHGNFFSRLSFSIDLHKINVLSENQGFKDF